MKKHQSEYLKQQRCGRKEIGQSICAIIEQDNHRHPAVVPRQVKPTRWRAGICKICGQWSTFVSNDHAQSHGFKDANEMVKAGVMKWTE